MNELGRRSFLRAAALGIGALAGCTADAPNEAAFWYSYGGKPRDVMLSLVDAFHAREPRYRIKAVYQGDYFETLAKIRTALSAGIAPALTHVVGEAIPYLVEAGVLERLDEQPELSGDFGLIPELSERGLFRGDRPEGTFALPFNRSTPIAYINREAFDGAGLRPPETWDELVATATKLTRGEGGDRRFGFACAIDWWFWAALVGQAGGEIFDDHGVATLGGEAGVEALELWRGMVKADVMRPPPGRDYNAWQVVNADFIEQRAAMIWTSTAYLRYFDEHARFAFATAPLPAKERRAVPTGGTFFVMPKGSTEQRRRAASAFVAFMMEPENSNRFASETGYMPITIEGRRILETSGYYERHPNDKVAIDQLGAARPWRWAPSLVRVQREAVQPRLEAAIVGGRSSREVLDEARAVANGPA